MTLRARLALLTAVAVAVAVVLVSGASYLVVRSQLRQQLDETMVQQARDFARRITTPGEVLDLRFGLPPNFATYRIQAIDAAGERFRPPFQQALLPLTAADIAVARGTSELALRDVVVGGERMRLATVPTPARGTALQLARPLAELDAALGRLALVLGLFSLGGVLVSASFGLVVARTGLAPVERLTAAAEHVARTQDLSVPIDIGGDDELGRLARSFNSMLAALEESRARQRRLVADASHELRTPLTSLRTNIELLARSDAHPERPLPPADREKLLADLTAQLGELTGLVSDVVQLARDEEIEEEEPQEVDLARLVGRAVERAQRRTPGLRFDADLQPWTVTGRPVALQRAVTNLLDNAAKWSPPGGLVEVTLRGGEIVVRDEGPGIAEEDLPRVFDRFYRAAAARNLPGSGLGLAIVRRAAESHGGTVTAERGENGGAVLRLRLPASTTPEPSASPGG